MKIFVISDTHFGHDKLVELSGRPVDFTGKIFNNLSKQAGDLLIHCGDFCIGNDDMWHDRFSNYTKDFKKKILIRGNHDNKSDSWYYDHGWDFVCTEFSNEYFGKRLLFTHKPVPLYEYIDFNIHGHMHGNKHRHTNEIDRWYGNKHIDLAPEIRDYKAVNLEKLLQ